MATVNQCYDDLLKIFNERGRHSIPLCERYKSYVHLIDDKHMQFTVSTAWGPWIDVIKVIDEYFNTKGYLSNGMIFYSPRNHSDAGVEISFKKFLLLFL